MSAASTPVPPLAPGAVQLWWRAGGPEAPRARRARIDRLLRAALSRHVGLAPEALRFGREPRGRPYLLEGDARGPLPDFNLSDTHGGTLIAVAHGLRVGVDLERTDRRPSWRALAERYFAASEAEALARLEDEAGRRLFLALWTAKESACKATGTGIYGRLASWQFAVADGDPALRAAPPEAGEASAWCLRRVAPAPGYTAVVACRGTPASIRLDVLD